MVMQNEYPETVGGMIEWCAQALESGDVFYGHGTEDAIDEAASLVFAIAGLSHAEALGDPDAVYGRSIPEDQAETMAQLLRKRIDTRVPMPYLLNEAWFCGLRFYVDQRVLIPRSPFAELIAERFEPWLDPGSVGRILEIGTGSGCIAIALALAFPDSEVVAADLMPDALEVARINVERHNLTERITLVESDLFAGVSGVFDLIVSNPPYVPAGEAVGLPAEYAHEPAVALYSGADGLDSSRGILQDAARHLSGHGMLALEVGAWAESLESAFPALGFIWPELEYGGEGIALLPAQQLKAVQTL